MTNKLNLGHISLKQVVVTLLCLDVVMASQYAYIETLEARLLNLPLHLYLQQYNPMQGMACIDKL